MKYKKLDFEDFSKALINTQDLDPVYVMLYGADLRRGVLDKFCLAYWCFYHSGVAAHIANQPTKKFWNLMQEAQDEKWPRGTERRHFRGKASQKAITYMREFGSPGQVVRAMLKGSNYATVATNVKSFPLFGPWIAFKIADMKERVFGEPCTFPLSTIEVFKDPRIGANMVLYGGENQQVASPGETAVLINKYMTKWKYVAAPPAMDRSVNAQEIETCLCKWKSHWRGHYPVGKDTIEIGHQLYEADCTLASQLHRSLPYERVDRWRRAIR